MDIYKQLEKVAKRELRLNAEQMAKLAHYALLDLAAKNAVIDALQDDLDYYRKEQRDQIIQDQGLEG